MNRRIAKQLCFKYPNHLRGQFYFGSKKVRAMKKTTFFALALSILLSLAVFAHINPREDLPRFELPNLITSAGQSADVQMASVLAKRAGLDFTLNKTAVVKDLEGMKTLTLVLGASLKGLGAAGIDVEQEKDRVRTLILEAKKRGIPLLCLHLGGEARRGQLTDQLVTEFLPYSRMVIIVRSGNQDGFFSKICGEKNIPLVEVDKTVDVVNPLKAAFQ